MKYFKGRICVLVIIQNCPIDLGHQVFKSVFVLGIEFSFHRIKGVLFFFNSLMNHEN